ncbi:MAG: PEP-CTERM sorting domain-containing protein [Verrucomicrobiota bacterium]
MKTNYRAAASAGLLLSACANVGHSATTVQTVVTADFAGSNFDLIFTTPVLSAEQLVMINAGSVNTGEGATLNISAIMTDNQVVEIFSKSVPPPFFQTPNLPTFTASGFTPFATPKDVKGLRFTSTGAVAGTFAVPALTVITFSVVPEPAAAIMMLLGVVFLAVRRRRVAA